MILPKSVVDSYGKEQLAIMRKAQGEIKRVAKMLNWTDDVEELMLNRQAMTAITSDIVSKYGAAAAANAAELFEAMDEAFTGTYKVAAIEADTVYQAVNASVHFAAESLFPGDGMPPDVDAFVSRICNSATRMINQQAMDTMAANHRDGVMYRRVTNGDNICPLCEELASRGYVWDVDQLIEPHDGCMCSLVPGFGEDPEIKDTGVLYPDLDDLF